MIKFVNSAIVSGLVILVPLVLLFMAIKEVIGLMVGMATPIADLFPAGTFDHVKETEILAALLILGTAFALGVFSKIKAGRAVGRGVEKYILMKIPGYQMLKSLVGAFLKVENEKSFKPALLDDGTGCMEPCYVIEDGDMPQVVVLVPWAPAAFAGALKLVQRESIHLLPISLDAFSMAITHFGVGLSELISTYTPDAQSE